MRLRCCVRSETGKFLRTDGRYNMFNYARIDFAATVPWQPFVSHSGPNLQKEADQRQMVLWGNLVEAQKKCL